MNPHNEYKRRSTVMPLIAAVAVLLFIWREVYLAHTAINQHVLDHVRTGDQLARHDTDTQAACPDEPPCDCKLAISAAVSAASANETPCSCAAAASRASLVDMPGIQERQSDGQTVHGVIPEQTGRADRIHIVPSGQLRTFEEFLTEIEAAVYANLLPDRPILHILSTNTSLAYPFCQGQWLEFGVAGGDTVRKAAEYKRQVCGNFSAQVTGFDTFTGLPEAWGEGKWAEAFKAGAFSRGGQFPAVPNNVHLVKGLFNESLPGFLAELDKSSGGKPALHTNVTFLHIDCDLYAGARDALQLLSSRIHPGCILIFDEIFHIPKARNFEVKAMYEWLQHSGRKVQVIGMKGPLPMKDGKPDIHFETSRNPPQQSAAFVVL